MFDDAVRPRLLAPTAELMLDALPPLQPQMRFLEVQAGGSVMARALVERIAGLGRLVAIDDDAALASALPAGPRKAARAVASAQALPFGDGTFDVVMANLVLGRSLKSDERVLTEVRRVLKPLGYAIVSVVCAGSFDRLLNLTVDVADRAGQPDLAALLGAARERLPETSAVLTRLASCGLTPAHHGIEERLLGIYRGPDFADDALLTDVVLAGLINGPGSDGASAALAALGPAMAKAIDGWWPDGLPVVVQTVTVMARPERQGR